MTMIFDTSHDAPWMTGAVCATIDPRLFYPPPGIAPGEAAKAVCADCPVRAACLNYALTERIEGGVWGGLNDPERRALWPRQKPCRDCPTMLPIQRSGAIYCPPCRTRRKAAHDNGRRTRPRGTR